MRPWITKPHSYAQINAPNWYNTAYRATGTYKGLGQDSTTVLSYPYLPGADSGIGPGTLNCPGDPGCPGYTPAPAGSSVTAGAPEWLPLLIGAAVFILVLRRL